MNLEFPATVTLTPPTAPSYTVMPAPGSAGPQGIQGVPGHPESVPWSYTLPVTNQSLVQLNTGLSFNPAGIICLDSQGNEVEPAAVSYPQVGLVEVTFGFPFTGTVSVS